LRATDRRTCRRPSAPFSLRSSAASAPIQRRQRPDDERLRFELAAIEDARPLQAPLFRREVLLTADEHQLHIPRLLQ
jgi:hypothetical protein